VIVGRTQITWSAKGDRGRPRTHFFRVTINAGIIIMFVLRKSITASKYQKNA